MELRVVGSFAGADQEPDWVLNLRDRDVNPRVKVRAQAGLYWAEHEVIDAGFEREKLWEALLQDRAWYAEYQAKTDRIIPLIRLPETEVIKD